MLKNLAENRLQEAAQSFLNLLFFFLQEEIEYNNAVFGPAAPLLSGKNCSQLEILHDFESTSKLLGYSSTLHVIYSLHGVLNQSITSILKHTISQCLAKDS